jgi:uncharacterized RDD family membrane protein YckC
MTSGGLWARPERSADEPTLPGGWAPPAAPTSQVPAPDAVVPREPPPAVAAPRASWGYRVGAFMIDSVAAWAVGAGVAVLLDLGSTEAEVVVGLPAAYLAWIAVTSGASAVTGGQSLGKLAAGMRVVGAQDGSRVGFRVSFYRDTLLRVLYVVPLLGLVDALRPLGVQRKALRDTMSGTAVIQEPSYRSRVGLVTFAAIAGCAAWLAIGALAVEGARRVSDAVHPGYTEDNRIAFVNACTDNAPRSTCECRYEYVSANLSHDEFLRADAYGRSGAPMPPHVQEVLDDGAAACP